MSINGPKHANEILVEDSKGNVVPLVVDEKGNLRVAVAGDIEIEGLTIDAVKVVDTVSTILADCMKAGLTLHGELVADNCYRYQFTVEKDLHLSTISVNNNMSDNRLRVEAIYQRGEAIEEYIPTLFGNDPVIAPSTAVDIPVNFLLKQGDNVTIDVFADAIPGQLAPAIDGSIEITGYHKED